LLTAININEYKLNKMMKNKRGISPLIATVLLIVIVIVIALLVFFWYTDVLKKQQEKEQMTSELICAQKVEFEVSEADCIIDANPKSVTFKATNTGSAHIDKFIVIVKSDDGDVIANIQTGTGVRYPETEQLSVEVASLNSGDIIELEIIPMIVREGKATECSEKSRITEQITC